MNTIEFISYLRSLDVKLWIKDDQLYCNVPRSVATPSLRTELAERKAEILAFLASVRSTASFVAPPIRPASRDNNALELSFAQQRLWFLDQLVPDNAAYNIFYPVHLHGSLDVAALEQCFDEVIRRQGSLRTTFSTLNGQAIQVIASTLTLPLSMMDLCGLSEWEQEVEVQRLAVEEAQKPFDLTRGPLLRATLLRLSEKDHVLLLTMHHVISDGWSMGILIRELAMLYEAFTRGKPSPLPELPIQYADFAVWQREWLQGEVLEEQLAYWKQQLDGVPTVLELPTDRPRSPVQTFVGATGTFALSQSLTAALKTLSREEESTLFTILLAAFNTLLYRYTGQEDILLGSPIANRNRAEIEGLIGFFVNMLALRADLSGNPTFRELVSRTREVTLGAYTHQDVPFEMLVEELRPERDLTRSPLFQVVFALNVPVETVEVPGLTLSPLEVEIGRSLFDLVLFMRETEQGLVGLPEYNTDLFDTATISRLGEHYRCLLEGIVADPTQRISDLPILTETERRQLLVTWNKTHKPYQRDVCIHELFEVQVARTPEAIAATFESETLTYQELDRQANQLAHHLKSLGVRPGTFVAVYLHRSLEMIPTLLSILKAGGTYVPLEPSFPSLHLQQVLSSLDIQYLITQTSHLQTFQDLQPQLPALRHVICFNQTQQPPMNKEEVFAPLAASVCLWNRTDIEQLPQQKPSSQVSHDNLAYIIFTSGSTGTPKGVMVQHRPVINLIEWVNTTFQISAADRILFVTSLCFDLSVYDIFGILAAGGSIQIVPNQDLKSPQQLLHRLCAESITFWDSAPAALQQLAPFLASADASNENCRLRLVFLSGDWIPVTLPDLVRNTFPGIQVVSLGGATEATVWSNYYPIGSVDPSWTSIPYGKPIQNTQYYILDSHLNPCPIGVHGDLYIGGECLSLGYANEPILTAIKYVPDPFSEVTGAVMYRTGDRARFWPDGNIEFLGRLDFQVKIRGYRIELGEIEVTLAQHPLVRDNLVIAYEIEDGSREKRLVAYTVTKDGQDLSITDLRTFLKERLPEHMMPSAFVFLEALPLTPNGKVDRQALPKPDGLRPEMTHYVAPRDGVEETLAGLWQQLLHIDLIGVHDNFFELGGNSLLITQLLSQVNKEFKVAISLQNLFEEPTVANIAELVRVSKSQMDVDKIPIDERLRNVFPTQREGVLETYLRQEVARSFGVEVGQLPADGSLSEANLGLLANDLILSLRRDLKLQLFADEIVTRPSIPDLTRFVLTELGRMSDLEAFVTRKPLSAYTLRSYRVSPRSLPSSWAEKNKSMLFLLSSPRAGSTLLRVMLAGHPDIFCPPELALLFFQDMQEWHQGISSQGQGFQWPAQGLQSALVELMGLRPEEGWALLDDMVAQNRSIQSVYAQLQQLAGDRLLVDKTPPYALDLGTLEYAEVLFESPKYIHLVRHPYSVIDSILRLRADRLFASRLFEEDNVDPYVVAETIWALCNRNVLQLREQIEPERYRLVRYEELVSEPRKIMTELCCFLGVPFDEALLNPYDGKRERMMGGIGDPSVLERNRIDASLGEVWKKVRLPRDLDESTKGLATELGYELTADMEVLKVDSKLGRVQVDKLVDLDKFSDEDVTTMLGELLAERKRSKG